jgi:uncharacterized protein (TIGR03435 family)
MSTNRPILSRPWLPGILPFLAIATLLAHAQSDSAPQSASAGVKVPAYDVITIRPDKSGSGSVSINVHDARYSATNVSVKKLLQNAYDIRENLISGVPGPIDSARFDIEAKVVDPDRKTLESLTGKQRQSMLRPLLIDRFQLKVHTEIKTLPVYDLVVIKGGPKFKQSTDQGSNNRDMEVRNTALAAHDLPMASLADTLAGLVNRTVIDRTGLAGNYDLALKWSPDDASEAQTDSAPSIFTALQEQLGVKLQSAKGPVETLIVDHVEMPAEN